jgi:hypothetical protein
MVGHKGNGGIDETEEEDLCGDMPPVLVTNWGRMAVRKTIDLSTRTPDADGHHRRPGPVPSTPLNVDPAPGSALSWGGHQGRPPDRGGDSR